VGSGISALITEPIYSAVGCEVSVDTQNMMCTCGSPHFLNSIVCNTFPPSINVKVILVNRLYKFKCLKLYKVSGRKYVIPVVQGPIFFLDLISFKSSSSFI
jgi:hypothetical protein